MDKDNVIAIDGPAASGKSTVAELVAKQVSAYYISTGNMYRAIALHVLRMGLDAKNLCNKDYELLLKGLKIDFLKGVNDNLLMTINKELANNDIRKPEVADIVSYVAKNKVVRMWSVERQRSFVRFGLLVMEGRDIGTFVFPNAKYKFFLTASPEVRAKRRSCQGNETPLQSTIDSVAKSIAERDRIDSTRKIAPLRKAEDAILVDSSDMNIQEVVSFICAKINN